MVDIHNDLVYYLASTCVCILKKELNMEFKSNVPIYLQVIENIRNKIISGSLHPGEKLPSSRELAFQYGINPNTAARVYTEMEHMGMTFTKRGIGTFITESKEAIEGFKNKRMEEIIDGFLTEMKEIGYFVKDIPQILMEYLDKTGEKVL